MVELARVLGCSGDLKAEGVARLALERLRGDKEYFLELREIVDGQPCWDFHSFYETYAGAQLARAQLRGNYEREFRIVELLRRVMP